MKTTEQESVSSLRAAQRAELRRRVAQAFADARSETGAFVPPGSSADAVAWRWVHEIVAKSRGAVSTHGTEVPDAFCEALTVQLKIALEDLAGALAKSLYELRPDVHPERETTTPTFTFVDLFAGIGGMRLGFERAGGRCVFSSEWDPAAQVVYFNNHLEVPFGDITQIPPHFVPEHDVLVGGFPCQPFSHAGKKLGIADTRGTLFHSIAEIAEAAQPRFIFLENVRGLTAHDGGRTLYIILRRLQQVGYRLPVSKAAMSAAEAEDYKPLKKEAGTLIRYSKDFGVPQRRPRVFLVLSHETKTGVDPTTLYPEPRKSDQGLTVATILRTAEEQEFDPQNFIISQRLLDGHTLRRAINKSAKKWGFGCNFVSPDAPYTATLSARYYKDGAEILIEMGPEKYRKLTPREASLLQGFPLGFELAKSKVQAYKQFGNSVTVPVVEAFASLIAESITSSAERCVTDSEAAAINRRNDSA